MLESLRIQNFKGWKDTGYIHTAPITLFFGANSSGKSSIGQFLMMLKQTIESPDRKSVFYPGGKNSAIQLGSYYDMVYHHDIKNKIAFEYKWSDLSNELDFKDPNSGQVYAGNTLDFQATVSVYDKEKHTIVLDNLKYDMFSKNDLTLSINMERKPGTKSEYKVDAEKYSLVRKMGRGWAPGAPVRFYGFPDEVVAYYQNADFVQILNLNHEKFFRSLSYLGPLRIKPERLYTWPGSEPESVGYFGENTVAAILAARNRKIGLGYRQPTKPFEAILAIKLKEMGLIEDFYVSSISEQRQEYEVKVKTKGARDFVDLPDVGFGVSQVLPVLVQCFYAPRNSIILMEQPEIHLHPSAQSALADVMIDVINSKENGIDRNIQLIIETHSEHFLRRLQRRIADDTISQDKVSVYFANINKTPATLDPLKIDMFGNILNWPENFFGDEMEDITEQAKATIKKRIAQNNAQRQEVSDDTLF
jgi:AAA15 family ATPase/GTPase